MTTSELYKKLQYVNHSREKRLHYTNLALKDPKLVPKLLEILFMVDDKTSSRAAWVFEFLCSNHIETIVPHLDYFTENMHRVHLDSSVRPVAKICELLATAYNSETNTNINSKLTNIHKERIIGTCFDYMIGHQKVAPKAYSMLTLFLLGKEKKYGWVHAELALILERDYRNQSAGYKARARHILKKIKKTRG